MGTPAQTQHCSLLHPVRGVQQQHNETFDHFFVDQKELGATAADLCLACLDTRLNTRIMSSVRLDALRKKLFALGPFPALKDVLTLCRVEESAAHMDADLTSKPSVNAASCSRRPQPSHANAPRSSRVLRKRRRSTAAVSTAADARTRLAQTALHKPATWCGKKHHFATVCEGRARKSHGQLTGQSSGSKRRVQFVACFNPQERQCHNVTVMVVTSPHNRPLGEFLASPDTGADTTIVERAQFNSLGFSFN